MKDVKPLISVIIPVYNVELFLDECIKSVIGQTYNNLEIILVDDGSPDNCPQICDDWEKKDSRIKTFHKTNGGLGSARNFGIGKAEGDYLSFVDSDDWIAPDMYEVLISIAEDTNSDITCGRIQYSLVKEDDIVDLNNNITVFSKEEYARRYFKIGYSDTVHYAVNKIYKRSVGKKIRFPEGVIDEDVEGFIYALSASTTIADTDHIVYFYRQNVSGISYKWFSEKQLDLLTVWANVREYCAENEPSWVSWAELNHSRAYFGLLTRLALNDPSEDERFRDIERHLLKNLHVVRKDLNHAEIPFSRKLILNLMCFNYDWARKLIRIYSNNKKEIHDA